MKRILVILLLFTLHSLAQTATIDTLFLPGNKRIYSNPPKLKFPIIKTGNKKTDAFIATDLKNRFTYNEYPDLPTDSTFIKWSDNMLSDLYFEVTYNQRGIKSFFSTRKKLLSTLALTVLPSSLLINNRSCCSVS
ncbi:MAG TPA: hypothetical protein VFF27_14625 [Bacteroidia bacterium]|jgi:hypothetical protein|nr:hypothetical protein [Bacteroidia bacterium]